MDQSYLRMMMKVRHLDHPYRIQKAKILAKRFIYKKTDTFQKSRQFPLRFLYKKQDTLRYAIFHEMFEVGIYTKKPMKLCVTCLFNIQKAYTSQKARQFELHFYIQKDGHFALHNFSWNF